MTEYLDFECDIKAVENDEPGTFEGYASVFDEVDQVADAVAPGAFKRTLRAHRRKQRMPALLWQHDPRKPIGVWDDLREDEHGLKGQGRLFVDDIPEARSAYALLKGGGLSGLSIGYRTVKSSVDERKKTRKLLDVDLFEVSLVTFPALDSARVSAVKGDIKTIREFEAFLRDEGGFSHAQAKAIASAGWQEPEHREDAGDTIEPGVQALLESLRSNASILKT